MLDFFVDCLSDVSQMSLQFPLGFRFWSLFIFLSASLEEFFLFHFYFKPNKKE